MAESANIGDIFSSVRQRLQEARAHGQAQNDAEEAVSQILNQGPSSNGGGSSWFNRLLQDQNLGRHEDPTDNGPLGGVFNVLPNVMSNVSATLNRPPIFSQQKIADTVFNRGATLTPDTDILPTVDTQTSNNLAAQQPKQQEQASISSNIDRIANTLDDIYDMLKTRHGGSGSGQGGGVGQHSLGESSSPAEKGGAGGLLQDILGGAGALLGKSLVGGPLGAMGLIGGFAAGYLNPILGSKVAGAAGGLANAAKDLPEMAIRRFAESKTGQAIEIDRQLKQINTVNNPGGLSPHDAADMWDNLERQHGSSELLPRWQRLQETGSSLTSGESRTTSLFNLATKPLGISVGRLNGGNTGWGMLGQATGLNPGDNSLTSQAQHMASERGISAEEAFHELAAKTSHPNALQRAIGGSALERAAGIASAVPHGFRVGGALGATVFGVVQGGEAAEELSQHDYVGAATHGTEALTAPAVGIAGAAQTAKTTHALLRKAMKLPPLEKAAVGAGKTASRFIPYVGNALLAAESASDLHDSMQGGLTNQERDNLRKRAGLRTGAQVLGGGIGGVLGLGLGSAVTAPEGAEIAGSLFDAGDAIWENRGWLGQQGQRLGNWFAHPPNIQSQSSQMSTLHTQAMANTTKSQDTVAKNVQLHYAPTYNFNAPVSDKAQMKVALSQAERKDSFIDKIKELFDQQHYSSDIGTA